MKQEYMRELADQYKEALTPLLRYLPWFEEHAGMRTGSSYDGSLDGNLSLIHI